MKTRIVLLAFAIHFLSCVTNINDLLYQSAPEAVPHTGYVYDDNIELEISFVGTLDDKYIFETVITNLSDYDIRVDRSQFSLIHKGEIYHHCDDLTTIIAEAKEEHKKLKQRNKTNNWLNGLWIGLGIVTGVAQGASAGSTLAFAIEPAITIVDENIWQSKNVKSFQDYISYLETAQFDFDLIYTRTTFQKDVFFNQVDISGDVEVEFELEGRIYSVLFPQAAFNYLP